VRPSDPEWILVGRAGRPHGVGGAFVVEAASEDPERLEVGAKVFVDGRPVAVTESKLAGGRRVIAVDPPVPRGSELLVPRSTLPAPGEDAYYAFQLLGLSVSEEGGRPLGRVREVVPGPANDVLELNSGLALPLVGACVREVDLDAGTIVIASGFADPL
jgi:16S rRNA processing protein RimM